MRAYEQARSFEALRPNLPRYYVGFFSVALAWGLVDVTTSQGRRAVLGCILLGAIPFFAAGAWLRWRRARRRYRDNLQILAELRRDYGEDLPWNKIERQQAELELLEKELAREKQLSP